MLFKDLKPSKSLPENINETMSKVERAKILSEQLFYTKKECYKYTEHKSKDGKSYWFCKKTQSSTWDKPECLSKLEGFCF